MDKKKLLIFTGAGFSKALVSKMFTTQDFYDSMKEEQENDGGKWPYLDYFHDLLNKKADVETLAQKIYAAKYSVDILAPDPDDNITVRKSYGTGIGNVSARVLSNAFKEMLDSVNSKVVHELDCTKISNEDANNIATLKAFLKELGERFSFNIFTTNYDNLMREHVLPNKDYYLGYQNHTSNVVDVSKLINKGEPYSYIPLKGFLDWQQLDGTDTIIQSHSFENNIQKSVIMLLEETVEPNRYPHNDLYAKFGQDLAEAERILFIGFSFRDPPINRIINSSKLKSKTAIIVTLESDKEQSAEFEKQLGGIFPKGTELTFHKDGFNDKSQKKILTLLT